MSNASDAIVIAIYRNALLECNRYLAIFVVLFGVVGHIGNILVLSQKDFRSNSCGWLFLVSSIGYFISICSALISRFLSTWSLDLTETNSILCKFRGFVIFTSLTCAYWLMVMATIDRWLSSSRNVNRRQCCSLRNARRGLGILIIFSCILQGHHWYCLEANLIQSPIKCNTRSPICRLLSHLTFELGCLVFPLLFMTIFSLMTIINIRNTRSRIHTVQVGIALGVHYNPESSKPTHHGQGNRAKKMDYQLLKLLFIQVSLIVLCTTPLSFSRVYGIITADTPKSPLKTTIESFVFNLFLSVSFISCGAQFYVNMLFGGVLFRRTFFSTMKHVGMMITCLRA